MTGQKKMDWIFQFASLQAKMGKMNLEEKEYSISSLSLLILFFSFSVLLKKNNGVKKFPKNP